MTEEVAVAQQPTTPVEQVAPATPQQPGQNQNTDWKARYDGLVRKVEELTLSSRSLNDQLAAKSSELEQLRGQLVVKDTEKTVTVGERDKLLQSMTQEKTALESELAELRGLKLKVEAIQDLGRPELLRIAHRIPGMTDKEALKTVLQDFAGFADDLVQAREKQLLAGVTPPLSGAGNSRGVAPASDQEWEQKINSLPLGSRERKQAFDDYYGWLEQKHKS
jgi:hypothetical protein